MKKAKLTLKVNKKTYKRVIKPTAKVKQPFKITKWTKKGKTTALKPNIQENKYYKAKKL